MIICNNRITSSADLRMSQQLPIFALPPVCGHFFECVVTQETTAFAAYFYGLLDRVKD